MAGQDERRHAASQPVSFESEIRRDDGRIPTRSSSLE